MISEKNQSKVFIPGYDGPLVSLSLFNELQHNILPIETIESSYKDYKSKYEQKKFQSFYVEHKDDEWFKEKYDPESSEKWRLERNSQCQKLAQKFSDCSFKNVKLELKESDENNRNIKILTYGFNKEKGEFEEKERDLSLLTFKSVNDSPIDISSAPYYGFDPDKLTLFLNQIPTNISRWQILDVLKKLPGFISMSLSEPIKNQNYLRYCWVTFDSEDNSELAYESLNDYRISSSYRITPIRSKSSTLKRVRVTLPIFDERLAEDLEFSKNLIQMFDKEKEILTNILFEENRPRELQLDLQILYLRRVHGFCYYCLEEYEDERALATKCDNIHLRNYKTLGTRRNENVELNKYEIEWDRNFTRLVKERIEKKFDSNKNKTQIDEELNKRRNEYCKNNTSSVNAERFMCNICEKMFKGPNFVHNHIVNKHLNYIQDNVDKEFYENKKYEDYVSDPNKLYEKYKVISSMEEYLKYLNTIKSFQQGGVPTSYDHRRPQSGGKYYKDRGDRDGGDNRRRRKDFKDYDAPAEPTSNAQSSGRQLISYDDL